MPIKRIQSADVAEPSRGLWSNCLVSNGIAYISGLTSRAKDGNQILGGDEYHQTKVIFEKMRSLLAAAGGDMDDVVKLSVFVTDIASREKVWAARREYFTGDFPCSTLVEVSALARKDILVEIEAVAHLGASN